MLCLFIISRVILKKKLGPVPCMATMRQGGECLIILTRYAWVSRQWQWPRAASVDRSCVCADPHWKEKLSVWDASVGMHK